MLRRSLHRRTADSEVISKWRLTWKERLEVLIYGHVWLRVRHQSIHPPVWVQGGKGVPGELKPE